MRIAQALTQWPLAETASSSAVSSEALQDVHWMLAPSPTTDKDPAWLNGYTDAQLAPFKVVVVRWYWSHIEGAGSGTTSGAFDWTEMDAMMAACAARGKYFVPFIMHKKFETNSHSTPFGATTAVVPSDLVASYQWTSGSTIAGEMYEATLRQRYQQAHEAAYDRYGGNEWFLGTSTGETAGMSTGTGYTLAKHQTELTALWFNLAAKAASKAKWACLGFNFLEGAWAGVLADLETEWATILDDSGGLRTDNVLFWSPDMLLSGSTNFAGVDNQVYPLFSPNYASHTSAFNRYKRFSSMQNQSLQTANNGNNDVDETFTTLRPLLELDGVIWTAAENWDYTFATPRTGFTYGDAVGVARMSFNHAYDSDYAVAT